MYSPIFQEGVPLHQCPLQKFENVHLCLKISQRQRGKHATVNIYLPEASSQDIKTESVFDEPSLPHDG